MLYVDPPPDELEELLLDDPEPDELPDELDALLPDELLLPPDALEELLLDDPEPDELPDELLVEDPELDEPALEELEIEALLLDVESVLSPPASPQAEIVVARAAARQNRTAARITSFSLRQFVY